MREGIRDAVTHTESTVTDTTTDTPGARSPPTLRRHK